MEVTDVYYVGGFGVMGWVGADDYRVAEADPLVDSAAEIIEHMNADHGEALRAIARHYAGLVAEEATMVSCDRLGFVIRAKTAEGMKGARIQFPEPVLSRADARRVLVAMTKLAKSSATHAGGVRANSRRRSPPDSDSCDEMHPGRGAGLPAPCRGAFARSSMTGGCALRAGRPANGRNAFSVQYRDAQTSKHPRYWLLTL